MSLDPVREARVRKMVLDPSTWPGAFLPMKRIESGCITEFGGINPSVQPDKIQIWANSPAEALHTFSSIDALIDAGWAVD